jgi:PAS domain S-box-containing protein
MSRQAVECNRDKDIPEPRGGNSRIDTFLSLHTVISISIILVILIGGWFFIGFLSKNEEKEIRNNLLVQAEIAALALEPSRVGALTATPSDIDKPDFAYAREKLRSIRNANKEYRFAYLTGLRNKKIVFLADAEPLNSKDYSPPGQIYNEASALFRSVFDTGVPAIDGPYADRWGIWVSGLAPIKDMATGRTVAVLGIDISVSDWNKRIFPGVVVTFLFCMAIAVFISNSLMRRQADAQLKASEERFRTLFMDAPEGIFIYDIETKKILETNPLMTRLFGFTYADFQHMQWNDLIQADGADNGLVPEGCGSGGRSISKEYLSRKKNDPALMHIEVTASALSFRNRKCLIVYLRDITERKRIEKSLRESQEKIRAVFDQIFQFIALLTPEGAIVEVNRSALKFSNINEADVLGRNFWETPWWVHSKPQQEKLIRGIEAASKHWEAVRFEAIHLDAEGNRHVVDFSLKPVVGDAGKTELLIAEGHDITEIKRMQDISREREEQYRTLVENINVGVFRDLPGGTGRFLQANLAAAHIFGYASVEEFMNADVELLYLHPEDRRALLSAIIKNGSIKDKEFMMRKKNGTPFTMSISAIAYYGVNGKIEWLDGVVEDITERKQTEEVLRRVLSQRKAILDNIPDLAWLKDREGHFIAANQAFGKACGVKPDDLIGKTDFDIWPNDLANRYLGDDTEVMTTGRRKLIEEPLINKDGATAYIETVKSPVYDEQGSIIGCAGIARDITERKKFEAELNDKLQDLKQFKQAAIDRENKMIDLKKEVNDLSRQMGKPGPYDLSFLDK